MKLNKEQYVDIGDISRAYGEEVCDVLPDYHSVTGCDTTSYPHKVGKVKPFKKLVAQNNSNLLSLARILPTSLHLRENMFTFMQTVMYRGKDSEEYAETQIRMYDQQKVK